MGTGDFLVIDSTSPQFSCPYSTAGNYLAVGRVKDKDGGFADYYTVIEVLPPPTPEVSVQTESAPVQDSTDPVATPIPENPPVEQLPLAANFSVASAGAESPLAVVFTNLSSGEIASVLWDFGDGSTSTEANPSHTYPTAEIYRVTLYVHGPAGESTFQALVSVTDSSAQLLPAPTVVPEATVAPEITEEALSDG
jgi:PKD repeat protein